MLRPASDPALRRALGVMAAAPPAFGLGRPAPLQRLKQGATFYNARAEDTPHAQVVDLQAIRDRLVDYHALGDENDANFQGRLHALRELDTAIYHWFEARVQGTIAETPNGPLLLELQRESETEHRNLIDALLRRQDNSLLPIDATGVGGGERGEALALWNRIVAGAGNLQIQEGESPAVRLQLLAAMAKLLQGGHGRGLIGDLSRGNVPVTMGSAFGQLAQDPQLQAGGNKAVPLQDLVDASKHYEFREVPAEQAGPFREYTGGANPHAFNQFLQALDRNFFKVGDKYFRRGTGSGSLVRITRAESSPLVGETAVANQYREVVTPNFVTIGHELGHARRIARGLAMPPSTHLPPERIGMPVDETAASMWTNAEELVNISSDENQIRREHGVTPRIFHKGSLANVQGTLNQARFNRQQFQIQSTMGDAGQAQLGDILWWQGVLNESFLTVINDWAQPLVFQGMLDHLPNLQLIVNTLGPLEQAHLLPRQTYDAAGGTAQAALDQDQGYQALVGRFVGLQPGQFAGQARALCESIALAVQIAQFRSTRATAGDALGPWGKHVLEQCRFLRGEGLRRLDQVPALLETLRQTTHVIRTLVAQEGLPEQLYAGANRAARRKLDTDERYGALRRQFNALLQASEARGFVAGARQIGADLRSRAGWLMAQAAAEESTSETTSSLSPFGFPFF